MRDRVGHRPTGLSNIRSPHTFNLRKPMGMAALLATGALVLPAIASAQPSSVTPLGSLNATGSRTSRAAAVSADGSVVVGSSRYGENFRDHAFRWTSAGGMVDLGDFQGGVSFSNAQSVSADGSVVAGYSLRSDNSIHAFRWTQVGGLSDLGTLGAFGAERAESFALDVSEEGLVVVGVGTTSASIYQHGFRWTQATGMVDLGTFGGNVGLYSTAYATNQDGSVIVGGGGTSAGYVHAFRWTQVGGMADLGALLGGGGYSEAFDVTPDGNIVVGASSVSTTLDQGFRWTAQTGMIGIGALNGGSSFADGVSDDGNIIVGVNIAKNVGRAFRWTGATGIQDLGTLLAQAGVDMNGITLRNAATASSLSAAASFPA